jgi:hypothetical protein
MLLFVPNPSSHERHVGIRGHPIAVLYTAQRGGRRRARSRRRAAAPDCRDLVATPRAWRRTGSGPDIYGTDARHASCETLTPSKVCDQTKSGRMRGVRNEMLHSCMINGRAPAWPDRRQVRVRRDRGGHIGGAAIGGARGPYDSTRQSGSEPVRSACRMAGAAAASRIRYGLGNCVPLCPTGPRGTRSRSRPPHGTRFASLCCAAALPVPLAGS